MKNTAVQPRRFWALYMALFKKFLNDFLSSAPDTIQVTFCSGIFYYCQKSHLTVHICHDWVRVWKTLFFVAFLYLEIQDNFCRMNSAWLLQSTQLVTKKTVCFYFMYIFIIMAYFSISCDWVVAGYTFMKFVLLCVLCVVGTKWMQIGMIMSRGSSMLQLQKCRTDFMKCGMDVMPIDDTLK
jgi:hypothetical protein